jgi:hypothetical protein
MGCWGRCHGLVLWFLNLQTAEMIDANATCEMADGPHLDINCTKLRSMC